MKKIKKYVGMGMDIAFELKIMADCADKIANILSESSSMFEDMGLVEELFDKNNKISKEDLVYFTKLLTVLANAPGAVEIVTGAIALDKSIEGGISNIDEMGISESDYHRVMAASLIEIKERLNKDIKEMKDKLANGQKDSGIKVQ